MLKALLLGITVLATAQAQTLPSQAQALLDQLRRTFPAKYQFAIDHGAQIQPTTDGRSFYLVWLPPGAEAGKVPMIASLHGSTSWAFDEIQLWHDAALEAGCGVIALQWWFANGDGIDSYYLPGELNREMNAAIQAVGVTPGSILLHGFSRGSANIYGVAAADRASQNRYYAMVVANSGGASLDFPPNIDIINGKQGYNVFSGTYWVLFCGGKDPNPDRDGCPAMRRTAAWVERYGGVIDLLIEDANAGHGGFHQTPAHVKAALDEFLHLLETRKGALPAGAGYRIERDAEFEIRGASIPNVGWMGDEAWLTVGTRQGSRMYRSADGSQASVSSTVPGLTEALAGTGYSPAEVVPRVLSDGRRALFVLGMGAPGSNKATVFRLIETAGRFVRDPLEPVYTAEPYVGVPDLAPTADGGLYLIYVALTKTPKNSEVALSTDDGATFVRLVGNPFGDVAVPNPKASDINVDPAILRLSRGGYLAVGMRAAKLYLFTGIDGRTFVPLSDAPIEPAALSPGATGLFDPTLLELPDGRIYLYCTAGSTPDGSDARVVRTLILLPDPPQ